MKKPVIGYTAGAFDMFHIGHLNLLRRSRLACDYLIVGVTTDECSVERKGKKPIIPLQERMAILESVKYVDQVVPQVNYDKFEAWNNLKFDVMFSGDDWQGTERWRQLEVDFNNVGVDIVYFSYTKHSSSTFLRSALEKIHTEDVAVEA